MSKPTSVIGATQLTVSASHVNIFKPASFEWFGDLRFGAGGSLEIVKPGAAGATHVKGGGYLVPSTGYQINSNSAIYLGSGTASTVIAHLTIHYTSGASLP